MNRESVTVYRSFKGYWYKKYDDYDNKYYRISKNVAIHDIRLARNRGELYMDDDISKKDVPLIFAYYN